MSTCVRHSEALRSHENARGKWFASDAPRFIASQTRWWKRVRTLWPGKCRLDTKLPTERCDNVPPGQDYHTVADEYWAMVE
jgi:hypothetical protein